MSQQGLNECSYNVPLSSQEFLCLHTGPSSLCHPSLPVETSDRSMWSVTIVQLRKSMQILMTMLVTENSKCGGLHYSEVDMDNLWLLKYIAPNGSNCDNPKRWEIFLLDVHLLFFVCLFVLCNGCAWQKVFVGQRLSCELQKCSFWEARHIRGLGAVIQA